jgi:hypothetical protein
MVKGLLGVYKINWDAAIDKPHKILGVGVIVRDSASEVLVAMSTSTRYITNQIMAEAYAT